MNRFQVTVFILVLGCLSPSIVYAAGRGGPRRIRSTPTPSFSVLPSQAFKIPSRGQQPHDFVERDDTKDHTADHRAHKVESTGTIHWILATSGVLFLLFSALLLDRGDKLKLNSSRSAALSR